MLGRMRRHPLTLTLVTAAIAAVLTWLFTLIAVTALFTDGGIPLLEALTGFATLGGVPYVLWVVIVLIVNYIVTSTRRVILLHILGALLVAGAYVVVVALITAGDPWGALGALLVAVVCAMLFVAAVVAVLLTQLLIAPRLAARSQPEQPASL